MMTNAGVRQVTIAFALLATLPLATVHAQAQAPETFTATATVKTAGGLTATAPVVITIQRWTSDADREKAIAALKSGDSGALKTTLSALPEVGTIQLGERRTPLHYARALPAGSGRVVTVVAPQPVIYVGAGVTEAKPKAGYDLALATFVVDASGKGSAGDLAPAAKLKLDANGAIVIDDYGMEAVRLTGIAKK